MALFQTKQRSLNSAILLFFFFFKPDINLFCALRSSLQNGHLYAHKEDPETQD